MMQKFYNQNNVSRNLVHLSMTTWLRLWSITENLSSMKASCMTKRSINLFISDLRSLALSLIVTRLIDQSNDNDNLLKKINDNDK